MATTPVSSLSLYEGRERYIALVKPYYVRRDGSATREHLNIQAALDRYVTFVGALRPLESINRHNFLAWRDQLAAEKLTRIYVNQCLKKTRRWVRWLWEQDLISHDVLLDIGRVHPLKAYRSAAVESVPPKAPALEDIDKLLPLLPQRARDILRLSRITAARPGELLGLHNGEIDFDLAMARPDQHKSAHHGHARVIPLTPEALRIIQRYWQPMLPTGFLFATKSRSGHYTISGYTGALTRACQRASVPVFSPYGVRRAVARKVRKERGLDAAQALLGHSDSRTTELYAPLTAAESRTLEEARRATEVL